MGVACSLGSSNSDIDVLSSSILSLEPLEPFQNLQIILFSKNSHSLKAICHLYITLYQLFKVKKDLHKLKPVCNYLNLKSCSLGSCNSDIEVLSSSILSLEPKKKRIMLISKMSEKKSRWWVLIKLQSTTHYTLPKNDLLCHLNWGAQFLMEMSSKV